MQLILPFTSVVTEGGEVVWVVPSNLTAIEDVEANPVPVTVTVEATAPFVGFKDKAGVTENEAVAVFWLASVAVTVLAPTD